MVTADPELILPLQSSPESPDLRHRFTTRNILTGWLLLFQEL